MELSPEEERHLLNLSVIPAALVTYILLVSFVYFAGNRSSLSPIYVLVFFGVPFAISAPTTVFLSFEVLYSRKAKQPIRHGVKRFLGRTSLVLLAVFMLGAILGITDFMLAPLFDESNLIILIGVVWFAAWIFLMFRFRKALSKLSAGQW